MKKLISFFVLSSAVLALFADEVPVKEDPRQKILTILTQPIAQDEKPDVEKPQEEKPCPCGKQ